ncbi:hypothetical protein Q4S41_18810 [Hymenobacter sp. CA1UV-4]|nr:hypothetical protein [Hymenobacter sp. CA1UV-4]
MAQAPNDNMENRRVLQLEETVVSNTANCTIQLACLNKALTGKQVQYHNDQWFEFVPPQSGRYFVNVSGQQCRRARGVQLIVLAGQPCQPATYRLLSCSSLGNPNDVFVTLQLAKGQPYLLELDGYTGDFCRFEVQISRSPKGIPNTAPLSSSSHVQNGRLVEVGWYLPDTINANFCTLWRRPADGQTSTLVRRLPVARNGYGRPQTNFSVLDTLPTAGKQNVFEYRVTADLPTGPPRLISRHDVGWTPANGLGSRLPVPRYGHPVPDTVHLRLAAYKPGAKLTVELSDALTGRVVHSVELVKKKSFAEQRVLPVRRFFPEAVSAFRIRITDHSTPYSTSGEIINYLL